MLQRMKQRFKNISSTPSSSSEEEEEEEDYCCFGEDELLEIAEILLQLPHLIVQSNIAYRPLYTWGIRRKRSALESSSPSLLGITPTPSLMPPPSQSTQPLLPPPPCHQNDGGSREEAIIGIIPKLQVVESTSPKTPLSFSPSESDSKPNNNKRRRQQQQLSHHKKKTKEEWQTDVITLSDQQETLKKELKKVMDYYDTLKAKNLQLKTTLQMVKNHFEQRDGLLDLCLKPQGPTLLVPSSSSVVAVPEQQQHHQVAVAAAAHQPPMSMVVCHRQPNKFVDQQSRAAACRSQITEKSRYPYDVQMQPASSSGVGVGVGAAHNNLGPRGIPDLNFTAVAAADESSGIHNNNNNNNNMTISMNSSSNGGGFEYYQATTFDMNKAAVTAEARRRRIEMKKVKKSMAIMKPRLQTR